MRLEERVVTPEEAKAWLEKRAENRDISKSVVETYTRQIKEGWWQDTSQTIAFRAGDDRLIDGQHRLSAIVQAAIPTKLTIIWDAPPHSFEILDRGYPRNLGFITKTPTFAVQCYTMLLNLARGPRRPAANEIVLLHKLLGGYTEALKNATSGNVRFFGSAPIRTAALTSLALGEKQTYIVRTYGLLSTGTDNGLPPVGRAFMTAFHRNILLPKESRGGKFSDSLYFRARYVFDARNAAIETWPRTFLETTAYTNEVKGIIQRALGSHFHSDIRQIQSKLGEATTKKEATHTKLTKQLARLIDSEQSKLSMGARD